MTKILDRIRSRGYWRVVLRPGQFSERRLQKLADCKSLVERSNVRWRGWDYPCYESNLVIPVDDSIAQECDFPPDIEYWRFFQSGQFVHYFAMVEDWGDGPRPPFSFREPSENERYLAIIGAMFRVTEVFEFASRLALKGVFGSSVEVSIELVNVDGRQLFYSESGRLLRGPYRCHSERISVMRECLVTDLAGAVTDLGLSVAFEIFERFNWLDPAVAVLAEDQRNLVERRS